MDTPWTDAAENLDPRDLPPEEQRVRDVHEQTSAPDAPTFDELPRPEQERWRRWAHHADMDTHLCPACGVERADVERTHPDAENIVHLAECPGCGSDRAPLPAHMVSLAPVPPVRLIGHRIRIAQEGWQQAEPATCQEDVSVGFGVRWVEIDGVRLDRVMEAQVVVGEGLTVPRLAVDVFGTVEMVYVDGDGDPLPGETIGVTPAALARVGKLGNRATVRSDVEARDGVDAAQGSEPGVEASGVDGDGPAGDGDAARDVEEPARGASGAGAGGAAGA